MEMLRKKPQNYKKIRIDVSVYEQRPIKKDEYNEDEENKKKEGVEKRKIKRREVVENNKLLKKNEATGR